MNELLPRHLINALTALKEEHTKSQELMNTVAAQKQQRFGSHFSDCKELRLVRDAPESVSKR